MVSSVYPEQFELRSPSFDQVKTRHKDHLAHLAFWEQQTLTTLQYIREYGEEPVDPFEGLSEDEINERISQESKDRSLQEVWNAACH